MAKYQPFHDLPAAQYEEFKADIAERGVHDPIHVDENDITIDGHQRRRACAELHIDCPRIVHEGLTEDEKVALAIALNTFRRHQTGAGRAQAVQQLKTLGWSNRRISEHVGVSHQTVGRELESGGPDGPPDRPVNAATGEIMDRGDRGSEPDDDRSEAVGSGDEAQGIATRAPSPAPSPAPPRVVGRDGKSYPATNRRAEEERRQAEAIGKHLAEHVPELTNGPAYREASKAIRQAWQALKDIDPDLAADGAETHEHSDLTMEKVDAMQVWLTSFRRGQRHLKVVER